MMFQREKPTPSDPNMAQFYGLACPLETRNAHHAGAVGERDVAKAFWMNSGSAPHLSRPEAAHG
jgi:hypothetical protein